MDELITLLRDKHMSVASIESLTAGMFCAEVAKCAGASDVLKGGLVTYQTQVKETVLHVDSHVIDTYGVISQECALQMAKQGMKMFDASIVVACSGNAGPSVMEDKSVGLVYIGIVCGEFEATYELKLQGDRNGIRQQVCIQMAEKIMEVVRNI